MKENLIKPKEDTWNAVWSNQYNRDENHYYLEAERCGQRWDDIRRFVKTRIKEGTPLKVLEIGAGRGTVSCLLHQEFGAEVNLLDFSPEAMKISKDFYQYFNVKANFIHADATNLPENLMHEFDIVYSGGLIEHFEEPHDILEAHFNAVKKGGFVIMNAPNAWCIPYRVYKFFAECVDKFEVGYEKPFNYFKLKKIAENRGYKDYSITGSGLLQTSSDWHTYFFRPLKKIIYKTLRLKYVETCRIVKEFKPERRLKVFQFFTAFLNINIKIDH